MNSGEIQAKTTFQKSARGPTAISEVSADGKFIVIENSGRKPELLGGWRLNRMVDDKEVLDMIFPQDFKVGAGDKFKVWASKQKPVNSGPLDIEASVENFKDGSHIVTKLFNATGDDRATHVQKTTYG